MLTAIPIEVCSFVLNYRIVNPFRTYLILKHKYSGKTYLDKNQLSKVLKISTKTLDKHLTKLRKLNWIGYNPISKVIFVRGFEKIREMHGFQSTFSVVCIEKDLESLRAFLYGALVSNILRNKKRNNWKQCASKNGNANHHCVQPFSHPVSNSYMAKMINCSISGAVKLKLLAETAGYIKTEENIQKTDVPISEIRFFKDPMNQDYKQLRKCGEKIGFQLPDLITTKMHFSRRKKSVTIRNG